MIEVVDRVPTYPNRVKITKSNGSSEFVTWERADEPTVPGTPINKALFDSIAQDIGLATDMTVYVSRAGSDALGTGTSAQPFATINKALSVLPKNLNGYTAYVSIAGGTYPEKVLVNGFANGEIRFTGAAGSTVTITKLTVNQTALFSCQTIQLYLATGNEDSVALDVTGNSYATFGELVTISGSQSGVVSREESRVRFTNLTANNVKGAAVYANGGRVHAQLLAGSGNDVAINANRGGVATYETMTLTSAVKYYASNGGRIYSGSQTNIPVY